MRVDVPILPLHTLFSRVDGKDFFKRLLLLTEYFGFLHLCAFIRAIEVSVRFLSKQAHNKLRFRQEEASLLPVLCQHLSDKRCLCKKLAVTYTARIIRDRMLHNACGLQRGIIRENLPENIVRCLPLHALCQHLVTSASDVVEDTEGIDNIRKIVKLHLLIPFLPLCNDIEEIRRVAGVNVDVLLVPREKLRELRTFDRPFLIVRFQPEEIADMIQPVPLIRCEAYRAGTQLALYIVEQLVQPSFVPLRLIGTRRSERLLFLQREHLRPFPRRRGFIHSTRILPLVTAEKAWVAGFTDLSLTQIRTRLLPHKPLVFIRRAFILLAYFLLCPAPCRALCLLRLRDGFLLHLFGRIAAEETHQTLFAAQCGGFDSETPMVRFRRLHGTCHVLIRQMLLHDLLVKLAGVFGHVIL